ncbi:hypothetical protein ACS0TY_023917 [Phlomoides rotata]
MIVEGFADRNSIELERHPSVLLKPGKRGRCKKLVNLETPRDEMLVMRPHNDASVIIAKIRGYDVARVFVDTSCFMDIIFYNCFKQMNLNIELENVCEVAGDQFRSRRCYVGTVKKVCHLAMPAKVDGLARKKVKSAELVEEDHHDHQTSLS